jgi:hypothetical protein
MITTSIQFCLRGFHEGMPVKHPISKLCCILDYFSVPWALLDYSNHKWPLKPYCQPCRGEEIDQPSCMIALVNKTVNIISRGAKLPKNQWLNEEMCKWTKQSFFTGRSPNGQKSHEEIPFPAIKEMYIKTTLRFYLTPLRIAISLRIQEQMLAMMWQKGISYTLL